MKTLIIGCGYVGIPLAKSLVEKGHNVFSLRRSTSADEEFSREGIAPLHADISKPEELARLPKDFDWVVNCAAAGGGGIESYRATYLEGTRNIIQWLSASPPKKYVYTSSTSVYGQTDGSRVYEDSPTLPVSETGKILVETEQTLLSAFKNRSFPAIILRVAGIYGPDRGYYFKQFLADEAKIYGKGDRVSNMIHRDDVAGVIACALQSAKPGNIYNTVDDEPVTPMHLYRWMAETLGKDMPPHADEQELAASPNRAITNKIVLNRKLKMELGYQFKFPTFRNGYEHEIKRLIDEGVLD